MGATKTASDSAFRDYNTEGVPGSGAKQPVKSEVRGIFDIIDTAISTLTSAVAALVSNKQGQLVSTHLGTVLTGTTTTPSDNTIPQNTEGFQVLSRAVTPVSTTSTLEIDVTVQAAHSVLGGLIIVALFDDISGANAIAAVSQMPGTNNALVNISFKHIMLAGSLSTRTFTVRVGSPTAGTTTINGTGGAQLLGGVMASRIVIKERLP